MDFQKAQQDLEDLTMDTSTEWAAGGTKNKKAVNKAYELIYDTYKNYEKIKNRIKTQKAAVTFVNKVGDLPADFDTVDIVSLFDFATDSDIIGMSDGRYYDFEVRGMQGSKKMYLEGPEQVLYVSYIPIREDLTENTDTFLLPEEIHPCVTDFALFWYNRMIRDDVAAANSLQIAQSIMDTKLASL